MNVGLMFLLHLLGLSTALISFSYIPCTSSLFLVHIRLDIFIFWWRLNGLLGDNQQILLILMNHDLYGTKISRGCIPTNTTPVEANP